ncbi:MAG: glycosyltransferase [Pseudomonadota bacterium]
MKILLVHRNFPGQFRYLAPALRKAGHNVAVLTWEGNQNPQPLPHIKYAYEMGPTREITASYTENALNGVAAARVAKALRDKTGEVPDVVFGIINWGETLFLREVWPEARHLGYAEFLYATTGLDTGFDPEMSHSDFLRNLRVVARKAHLLQAAVQADALMAPTKFQASTFPPEVRSKMSVIHDGVDTKRIAPKPDAAFQVPEGPLLRAGDEVLTFVNRTMEPYRGFHTFMRALPQVLASRPNAQVLIVGSETGGYGPVFSKDQTWKEVMLAEVGDRLDLNRVHFLGRVSYEDFLSVLQVGRAHAYLTYPFVLSWSMMEAMSVGAHVVGSATPPVQEIIADGVNGTLVDFFDVDGWARTLTHALAEPEAYEARRAAARQTIVDRYDLKSVCLPKLMDFVLSAGVRAEHGATATA